MTDQGKREHLKSLLNQYVPSSKEEEFCKQKFLFFVENHEECLKRSFPVGHVTASAWLLNHDGSKALLMHHRKLDRWLQLGGHFENQDADIISAAIREAQEESGISSIQAIEKTIFDIDIHCIPASSKEEAHYHYDVRFLLQAINAEEKITLNPESNQLKWIGINDPDIPTTEPSVIRLFTKWKNRFLNSP